MVAALNTAPSAGAPILQKSPRMQMPDGNQVEFEYEAVEAKGRNEQNAREGKPEVAFDQVLVARVYSPGVSRRQVPVLEIERHFHDGRMRRSTFHYPRFQLFLDAWRNGGAGVPSGTALESCGLFNAGLIAAFKHNGVQTVEQLAKVPDSALSVLGMNGRESRDRAIAYLAAKTGGEAIAGLDERLKSLEASIQHQKELEKENGAQARRIAELEARLQASGQQV